MIVLKKITAGPHSLPGFGNGVLLFNSFVLALDTLVIRMLLHARRLKSHA